MNKILNVFNNIPLEDQYKGFRVLFWVDIVLATLLVLFGSSTAGLVLFIIGLQLGVLSNNKLNLINQERIENKIDNIIGYLNTPLPDAEFYVDEVLKHANKMFDKQREYYADLRKEDK